jgi:hypothetical protein
MYLRQSAFSKLMGRIVGVGQFTVTITYTHEIKLIPLTLFNTPFPPLLFHIAFSRREKRCRGNCPLINAPNFGEVGQRGPIAKRP